jgi:hypothetical protein
MSEKCDELDFSPRIRFPEVIAAEYDEINQRRKAHADGPVQATGRPPRMIGLALSGGGVRSATFNLGLLQALAEAGKLKLFDYLSTVSGGGYVGGWWSAWLAREARETEPGKLFPEPEDIESERDDRRAQMESEGERPNVDRPQIKDSAINAAEDPIHHLRLFSNVMTPRKGLLSADTWRAVAVIGRNICLTWIILVPILLAAILIGQAWFTLIGTEPMPLATRLGLALAVPGLLFIGSVVCVVFWMLFSRRWKTLGDKVVVILSTVAFLVLTALAIEVLNIPVPEPVCLALIAWILYVIARLAWWKTKQGAGWSEGDFWRNRVVNLQTKTLSYSIFALVIFLFAGFGHLIFEYLLNTAEMTAAKAGGWGAVGLAALSSAYTALKASPTGGGDNKPAAKPPMLQKIAFAIAPPLLLLVLGVFLSWVGDRVYGLVVADQHLIKVVAFGALLSASLFLIFALYEFRPPQRWKALVVVVVWLVLLAAAWILDPARLRSYQVGLGVATLALLAAALTFRAILRRRLWIGFYAAALLAAAVWIYLRIDEGTIFMSDRLPLYVMAGALATLVLLVFELLQGRGANTRSIALTVIACTIFVLIGVAGGADARHHDTLLTLVGLIATVLGWVLALGWLADPNSLTMHAFYKARLVRAYLGASNEERARAKDADITDAVPGDDILLTQLRNTERGAPYHLVNAMLNLVGGSDISTQARASDSFLMSKLYCGSIRTGYRRTNEYACGTISLGTAVAVSGAAASPSMGSQTPSAALSALMTLFNIRLGYWAPTPSLSYWRSAAARLWPVYTLQELVSQTTDLLPYCYLTDGGHYENTGVYSLVQRGCSLIVVGECGADPSTTLDDLGNMIRKVRIDFDTEIVFQDEKIDQLRAKPPAAHVIVGTIFYGEDHARALGLSDDERVGTIVVVKPNLAGGEPVDVKQYGYLHSDFPQQFTFDLWYDEAQFESYRRLGEESGKLAATFL